MQWTPAPCQATDGWTHGTEASTLTVLTQPLATLAAAQEELADAAQLTRHVVATQQHAVPAGLPDALLRP